MQLVRYMQRVVRCVSQVSLLAFCLSTVICAQAAVPVEAVQPSGYGQTVDSSGQSNRQVTGSQYGHQQIGTSSSRGQTVNGQTVSSQTVSSQTIGPPDWVGSLLNQVNSLQQQVQKLRGQLEEQNHKIVQLQAQSKQRYLDLDRRFSQLVTSGSSPSDQGKGKGEVASQTQTLNLQTQVKPLTDANAYKNAFQLISQKKFEQAIAAFTQFISDYPESKYVSNAQYWLGEIYSATGNTNKAEKAFLKVVTNYPKSNKVADAMYKLGQIYAQSGNKAQARQYLQKVIQGYPDSSAAQLSRNYLQSINQ